MRNVFNKGVFYRFFVLLGENAKIFFENRLKKVAKTPLKIHIGEGVNFNTPEAKKRDFQKTLQK